jgi:hypothetical protein
VEKIRFTNLKNNSYIELDNNYVNGDSLTIDTDQLKNIRINDRTQTFEGVPLEFSPGKNRVEIRAFKSDDVVFDNEVPTGTPNDRVQEIATYNATTRQPSVFRKFAVSFIAPASGKLVGCQLFMNSVTGSRLACTLVTDSAGNPNTSNALSGKVLEINGPKDWVIPFTADVVIGTKYWVVVEQLSFDTIRNEFFNQFWVHGSSLNSNPNSESKKFNAETSVWEAPDQGLVEARFSARINTSASYQFGLGIFNKNKFL